ncbi:MAG: redoxin domain-containing protein [Candidatus Levyibacteriota bacterium]
MPQEVPQAKLFNENKPAPELTGITKWLNPEKPLTLASLRGKVVLIDFWTNQCINCIRTLPYVTKWYDTYHDQGFVVIGVHTPELASEYSVASIEQAITQYTIHYPVAQDNNYATWKAYDNAYWPGFYLIDKKGIIRRTHFGEGEYTETEQAIKTLLSENSR